MKKGKILIYGIGSMGKRIYELNKRDQLFDIEAFIDDRGGRTFFLRLACN
jgi:hypothetical protein